MSINEAHIRYDILSDEREQQERRAAERRGRKAMPYVTALVVGGIGVCFLSGMVGALLIAAGIGLTMLAGPPEQRRHSSVAITYKAAGQVLAVDCPKCGAEQGNRCQLPCLDTRVCHGERGQLYWNERHRIDAELHKA